MIKVLSMSEFGMNIDDSSTKAPIMVIAFAGWNDAGGASTWAIRSLIEKTIATEILTFDSEEFYDFSRERPTVHLDGESRFLSWPKNTISLSNDGSLLLMEGVEPQLNWQTFTQNILAEAQKSQCLNDHHIRFLTCRSSTFTSGINSWRERKY